MTAYRDPPLEDPPALTRRWWPALLALAAWVAGNFIPMPLPGVDRDAARAFVLGSPSDFAPYCRGHIVSLVGTALSAVLVVRAVLALATHGRDEQRRRRWHRRAAVIFGLMMVTQGLSTAIWLESAHTHEYISLVAEPGWAFRAGLMALFALSGAAVWALATVITRANVAHGPMALVCAELTLSLAASLYADGRAASRDHAALDFAGTVVGTIVPTMALLVALWRWSPRSWPQRFFRGVQALSPLDLLPLPLYAASRVSLLAERAGHAHAFVALALQLAAGLAVAGLIARWLRQRSPYAPSRASLAAAIALPLACIAAVAAGMVSHGGRIPSHVVASFDPSPAWTTVSLRGDEATASIDAPRLVERLRALHHRAEVAEANGGRISLRVAVVDGDARAVVASLLPRGDFAIYRASDDQEPLMPSNGPTIEGLAIRVIGRPYATVYAGPTEESLAPVVRRSESAPGAVTRIHCSGSSRHPESRCFALRLEPTPAVTNRHIASAEALTQEDDGSPYVRVVFTPEGARAFEALTRASVRHLVAIVLDERIHSAPEVLEPITGGAASVSFYDDRPMAERVAAARAIAASLSTEPLAGRWSLAP